MALPHLVAEVHRGQPVDQTVLILEALLRHIKGLLHSHSERDAKCKDEAAQDEDDVDEVNVVGGPPWRANKRQLLEVHETIVNESKEDGTEDHEAEVDDQASHSLYKLV